MRKVQPMRGAYIRADKVPRIRGQFACRQMWWAHELEGSRVAGQRGVHLLGGEGGGSNPTKLSRFSGTYSWKAGDVQG